MEQVQLGEIIKLMHSLVSDASLGTNDDSPVPLSLRMSIENTLNQLRPHCERLGLKVPVQYIENARQVLGQENPFKQTGMLGRLANMIFDTIEIELRGRYIFALRAEHAKYGTDRRLFGSEVATKFPSAAFDLDEAGKCFALDRYTACVFHLMRVMEIGIGAARRCLGMPDPVKAADRNWGTILRNFKDELGQHSWKDPKDKILFEELYVSLDAVRNPWRNATMHVENKYTEDEAEHIFVAVRGFMKVLASRMDESGEPKA